MVLVTAVYQASGAFPKDERFGLTQQIRRCAVSIPSNIAEGFGRSTRKEEAHFLMNARGSLHELDTQLEIAGNLGYVAHEERTALTEQIGTVGRMLNGLVRYVRQQDAAG